MKKTAFVAALVAVTAAPVIANEATIVPQSEGVTFVNIMTPAEGVTLDQLAAELTQAMEDEIRFQPGFKAASVHVARDGSYVLNYAQWDSTDNVDAVVALLQQGELPELAEAFDMASPEFHPYDVVSVTVAAE